MHGQGRALRRRIRRQRRATGSQNLPPREAGPIPAQPAGPGGGTGPRVAKGFGKKAKTREALGV